MASITLRFVCWMSQKKKSTDDTQRFDLSVKLLKQIMKGLWKEHNTARKLEYIYYQGAIPCNLLFPRNNIPVQNSQETHLECGISIKPYYHVINFSYQPV